MRSSRDGGALEGVPVVENPSTAPRSLSPSWWGGDGKTSLAGSRSALDRAGGGQPAGDGAHGVDEGEGSIDAGEGNDEGKEDKGAQDNDEGKEDKGAQGTTQDKGAQGTTQDKWKPYVSVHLYGSTDEGTIERVAKYWPSPTIVIHIHSPNMSDPKAPSNVEFSSLGVYRGLPK